MTSHARIDGNGRRLPSRIPGMHWVLKSAVVLTACWVLHCSTAIAQELLLCGVPSVHTLQSGATDTYGMSAGVGQRVVVDVTDNTGALGLLRLRAVDLAPIGETCNGSLQIDAPANIEVSDCLGTSSAEYTVEYNVVSDTGGCAVPLTCGIEPGNTTLSFRGEVDSYRIAAVAGQPFSLSLSGAPSPDRFRLRVFNPQGHPATGGDTCSGNLTLTPEVPGDHTVLVSACSQPITGEYTLLWQTDPACAAPSPNEVAYVTDRDSGSVSVVDTKANRVVAIIPLEQLRGNPGPAHIAVTPNSGFAYVTFGRTGALFIINTTTNRLVEKVSLPIPEAEGNFFAFSPDGKIAYIFSDSAGGMLVFDTTIRRVTGIIKAPDLTASPPAVTPNGQFLYVPAIGGRIAVIDLPSRSVIDRINLGFDSEVRDITFSTDGSKAYATQLVSSENPNGGKLSLIDTATRTTTSQLSIPAALYALTYSADRSVAYAVDGEKLTFLDTASGGITTLSLRPSISEPNSIALSVDGRRLFVTDAGVNQVGDPAVAVVDVALRQVLVTVASAVDEAAWDVAVIEPPSGLCDGDERGETRVTVGELVSSVNFSVDGCPTQRRRRLQ